jgi:hypothetical protein
MGPADLLHCASIQQAANSLREPSLIALNCSQPLRVGKYSSFDEGGVTQPDKPYRAARESVRMRSRSAAPARAVRPSTG